MMACRTLVTATVAGVAAVGVAVATALVPGGGASPHPVVAAANGANRAAANGPDRAGGSGAGGAPAASGAAGAGATSPGGAGAPGAAGPSIAPPTGTLAGSAPVAGQRGFAVVPPHLPAAPAGFAGQVTGVYDGIYAVQQVIVAGTPAAGTTVPSLPAPTAFAHDVAGLTPPELAELYAATRRHPEWSAVVANERRLAAGVPTAPAGTDSGTAALMSPTRALLHGAAAALGAVDAPPFPPPSVAGSFPSPPAPYQASSPVAPYQPIACPLPAPGGPPNEPGDTAIFTQQLTSDVAGFVAADVPSTILVVIAGEGTSIPDPAKYIATAISQAAKLTLDSFNFEQALANDCDNTNRDGLLANIDNTTVNTFALLTAMEGTLGSVQSGIDTIGANLTTLQQTLDDQVTLAVEQALAAPAQSVPNLALELPSSVGGYLDSVPTGVQSVVTAAVASLQQAGEPVNAMAVRDLAAGDAALAAGQYAQAYAELHQAYLQAVG